MDNVITLIHRDSFLCFCLLQLLASSKSCLEFPWSSLCSHQCKHNSIDPHCCAPEKKVGFTEYQSVHFKEHSVTDIQSFGSSFHSWLYLEYWLLPICLFFPNNVIPFHYM
ncbi:unnamed protein product [Staurois parvus]|uniref:Uncharacterized protein n=1 Tax=Staurois parvus TaxID=386267 RepID=A0ABN9E3P4_9NEOB|nr:unnamed protein product [Staurois parvus]